MDNENYKNLDNMRKNIEAMNINHHIEIGKIFKKNNIKLTENKNGIFINLTNIPSDIINEIQNYIDFVKNQELIISLDEVKKENIENIYFKNIKDKILNINDNNINVSL